MHPIAEKLLAWFEANKRDLPWRHTSDPYSIWISEIMLQQTRTETVKGYWTRFLREFPDIGALAAAPEQAVLKAWEGLGYYSRARNLQKAARVVMECYGGTFPSSYEQILSLPGIGPYTAGAVGSIAFSLPVPAIDGNVYRVSSRLFGIREEITAPSAKKKVDLLIRELIPLQYPGDFNQALMELGATCCCPGTPDCVRCPLADYCDACAEGDAEFLPVHESKKPPRQIEMAVCLITYNGRIYIECREEALLHGMYVFRLEENNDPESLCSLFREQGLECSTGREIAQARHVFTHRIWNMHIYHFEALSEPSAVWNGNGFFTDDLSAQPFPAAMKVALAEARKLLG